MLLCPPCCGAHHIKVQRSVSPASCTSPNPTAHISLGPLSTGPHNNSWTRQGHHWNLPLRGFSGKRRDWSSEDQHGPGPAWTSVPGCISHRVLLELEKAVQIRRNQLWAVFFLPHTTGSAGSGMGISPDRGKPSPLKRKTLESPYHHVLLNDSKLITPFIINPVRIRWNSGRLAFDLRVCQEMTRILGSVRWLPPAVCTTWNCASRQKQGTWKRFLVFWGFFVVFFSLVFSFLFFFFKKKKLVVLGFIAISLQPVSGQSLSDTIYWQQTVLLLQSAWGNGLRRVSTINWCKMR